LEVGKGRGKKKVSYPDKKMTVSEEKWGMKNYNFS